MHSISLKKCISLLPADDTVCGPQTPATLIAQAMSLPILATLLLACCGGLHLAAAQGSCYDNTVSTDPAAQKINATASSLYAVATTYVGSWTSCFSIPMSGYAVFGGNKVAFSGVCVCPQGYVHVWHIVNPSPFIGLILTQYTYTTRYSQEIFIQQALVMFPRPHPFPLPKSTLGSSTSSPSSDTPALPSLPPCQPAVLNPAPTLPATRSCAMQILVRLVRCFV